MLVWERKNIYFFMQIYIYIYIFFLNKSCREKLLLVIKIKIRNKLNYGKKSQSDIIMYYNNSINCNFISGI